jgi:hypothetical protein
VFSNVGGTWSQQAKLIAPDGRTGDAFGASVSLSASTALITAPANRWFRGAAYVFAQSGDTWSVEAKLVDPTARQFDLFGSSAALSGSTAVIGEVNGGALYAGDAYVVSNL